MIRFNSLTFSLPVEIIWSSSCLFKLKVAGSNSPTVDRFLRIESLIWLSFLMSTIKKVKR